MSEEMKACPFCGKRIIKSRWDKDRYSGHSKKCHFYSDEFIQNFYIYDIKAWNTRHPSPIVPRVTEIIEDIELAELFIQDGGKNEALQILDRVKEAVSLLKRKEI